MTDSRADHPMSAGIAGLRREALKRAFGTGIKPQAALQLVAAEHGHASWRRLVLAMKPTHGSAFDVVQAYEHSVAILKLTTPPTLAQVVEEMRARTAKSPARDVSRGVRAPTEKLRGATGARRIWACMKFLRFKVEVVEAFQPRHTVASLEHHLPRSDALGAPGVEERKTLSR